MKLLQLYSIVVQQSGTFFHHGNRRGTNQLYQTQNPMGLLQWYSIGVSQGGTYFLGNTCYMYFLEICVIRKRFIFIHV